MVNPLLPLKMALPFVGAASGYAGMLISIVAIASGRSRTVAGGTGKGFDITH